MANRLSTLMPSPRAIRWLFTAARTCAPKRVDSIDDDEQDRDQQRDGDEEQPVDGEVEPHEADRAVQIGRQVHRLLVRSVDIGRRCDRDEHDADGQQALIEFAGVIKSPEEHALEHDAGRGGGDERDRQRREERPAECVHQRDGDVAAEHGEAAVRQVDEIHHPERHRQPDRHQEQQHPVGEAVEQHAEDGRHGRQPTRRCCRVMFFMRSGSLLRVLRILDVRHAIELDVAQAHCRPSRRGGCRPSGRYRAFPDRS